MKTANKVEQATMSKLDMVSAIRSILYKSQVVNRASIDRTTRLFSTCISQIPDVDIDPSGKFKYILIQVSDPETKEEKYIVRGYKSCGYHVDILERVEPSIEKLKCKAKCVGGGRILHNPEVKSILIYGYSQGFGKADHTIAHRLVKAKYPNYTDISWSNEGY